jgi:hypothetical protein
MTTSLTIVIPTRNRAHLAVAAATGLLGEGPWLRVLVSDNSSDELEADALARFCRQRADPRLTYLRAPDLTMPAHWNWALEQALTREETSHFSIHYDRKVPKPGQWRFIREAIEDHPDKVVTYSIDQVTMEPPRWVVWRIPWSGKTYEIRTARVCRLASEGRIAAMGHAFPVLSNCAVPRGVFDDIRRHFGDICDSTGPDAAFTFRFCALADSYLHLDRSLGVVYANDRSNGAGFLSGKTTDFVDFKQSWGDRPWLDSVPLPGLDLGWNMLFHEYELVRQATGDQLPPLSRSGYLDGLAYGLRYIEDGPRREAMTELLEAQGWRPSEETGEVGTTMKQRLRRRVGRVVRRYPPLLRLASAARLVPEPNGFTFDTEEKALRFATAGGRRRTSENPLLDPLLEPEREAAGIP